MNLLLAILTAIATSATAIIAFFALKNERERRRINIFSESIHTALDGDKNSESLDYILSCKYNKDIELVKHCLGLESNESVCLEDFRRIVVQNLTADGCSIDEKRKEELRKSYKKICYFCKRMEYLGIVAKDKAAQKLIVDYYKSTIIATYRKLEPLIVKTRFDQKSDDIYKYYTVLYNWALESENNKQK